jgi:hypothetical protein
VVQAAFEHETRDLTAAYQVLSACGWATDEGLNLLSYKALSY